MQKAIWKVRAPGIVFGIVLIIWAVSEEPLLGGGPGFGLAQLAVAALGLLSIFLAFLWRPLVPYIISGTISLLVALVLAEMTIGAMYAPKYATPFEYDQSLHYKLVPGAIREYQHTDLNGGEKFSYVVNNDGFRGPPLKEKRANEKRVAVYGDSFIHGEYSPYEETFVAQLEKVLEARSESSYEVVNAGVAGYGPDQALIKMQKEITKLQPDLVVMALYAGNDFGDLVRNKFYRVGSDGELIVNDFKVPDETINRLQQSRDEPIIRKILREMASRWRHQNAATAESAEGRIDRFLKQHIDEYEKYVVENNNVVGDLQEDPYTADISLYGAGPSVEYKAHLMKAVLSTTFTYLEDLSIPAILVVIPHPIDASGGKHDSGHVVSSIYPEYVPSRLSNTAVLVGEEAGFPVINLFPKFAENDPSKLYFLGGDDHWNADGQAFAASIVADFIQEANILSH